MSILYNPPSKVIWIRKGNCSTQEIEIILRRHLKDIEKLSKNELPSVLSLI